MDETQTYSSGTPVDTLRLLRNNALLEVKHFACKFRCEHIYVACVADGTKAGKVPFGTFPPLVPSATQANIFAVKISDSF